MISMSVNPALCIVFMGFLIFYGSCRFAWRRIGVPTDDDKVHLFELSCRKKVSLRSWPKWSALIATGSEAMATPYRFALWIIADGGLC